MEQGYGTDWWSDLVAAGGELMTFRRVLFQSLRGLGVGSEGHGTFAVPRTYLRCSANPIYFLSNLITGIDV